MDSTTELQIATLREMTASFDGQGLPYWLFGGWAVDFAAGRITRVHDDIDIVVRAIDRDRAKAILRHAGFRERRSKHPQHQSDFLRSGTAVQIDTILRRDDGAIVSPGSFEDWPWLAGSFGDDYGSIGDLRLRIVSPAGQLEAKVGFPVHRLGRPHRDKDRHDIRVLRAVLGAPG